MKLKFKNKMLMAMDSVLWEGDQRGGIPQNIELSEAEARQLLEEVHYLNNEDPDMCSSVAIKPTNDPTDLQDDKHPIFLIKEVMGTGRDTLPYQTVNHLIQFWRSADIIVTYKDVPLVIEGNKATGQGWV